MGQQFYHVDRTGGLEVGETVELGWEFELGGREDPSGVTAPNGELLRELFPEGVTRHGIRHLSVIVSNQGGRDVPGKRENLIGLINTDDRGEKPIQAAPHTSMYEWCFELVRRAEFPEERSRFQSVFAWDDPQRGELRAAPGKDPRILRVEAQNATRRDMSLIDFNTFGTGMRDARAYWKGETRGDPTWEYLLEPPVEVVGVER